MAVSPSAAVPDRTAHPPSIVSDYALRSVRDDQSRFNEMLDAEGQIRPGWSSVAAGLAELGNSGLSSLRDQVDRLLDDDGVSYNPIGNRRETRTGAGAVASPSEVGPAVAGLSTGQRRWKLDPVPLVVGADDWAPLEAGFRQRAVLLDGIVTDVYGSRSLIRRGFIPPELVFGSRAYLRPAHGLTIPGPHQLLLYAADVFRDPGGSFQVINDRTEAPAGAGYAMADRRVVSRVSPDLFRRTGPLSLTGFFRSLLVALQSAAPRTADDPRVVVLSPGVHSETAYDQAVLASLLGVPLVESADLTVREGRVWMRALGRHEPVDVLLRRVDSDFADPLDLRPDSQLGVVGLVEAARRGTVTVVNPLGVGILENPGLLPLLPALCRELLGEELKLPSVESFWCGEPASLSHVQAHFADMVLRPTDSGRRATIVSRLDNSHREVLLDRVRAEPGRWVGQPFAPFSVAPVGGRGGLVDGQVGMRLFAVAQPSGYQTMPGGLGRVLPLDGRPGSSDLAEAKDVWIASPRATQAGDRDVLPWVREPPLPVSDRSSATSSPRALEDLYWFGRYAERVEDLTRLLIATWQRLDESRQRGLGQSDLLPTLLATVTHSTSTYPGFARGPVDVLTELRSLLLDDDRTSSLAQSLSGLRESAAGVRDQLSRDTWVVLAGVDRALAELRRNRGDRGPVLSAALNALLAGMLALSGLAAENMIRDPGWYLMDAGRRLERSVQLVTVLRWAFGRPTGTDDQLIESVLVFAESIVTYRRRYRGSAQLTTVLELLLLDGGNPRSLAYQLQSLGADLHALPDSSGTSVPERLLDDLVATLRRTDPGLLVGVGATGERERLIGYLDDLRADLTELAEAVAAQRFRHVAPMQQLEHQLGAGTPEGRVR